MARLRVKGQEVTITLTGPNGDIAAFENCGSIETSVAMEILEEGYLGTTANDYDEIYNGVTGKLMAHMGSNDYWRFQQLVQDRAERRTPASGVFNVSARFNMPNGEVARITHEDVHFGEMPANVGSRKDYVETTISWSASRSRRVL